MKKIFLKSISFLYLMMSMAIAQTSVINTIAGNGTNGYAGDGGLASASVISWPQTLAIDTNGNIYFSNYGNSIIRKIEKSTNIITTVAGNGVCCCSGDGGLATAAKLGTVDGVAVDKDGNIYIADRTCNVIRKVDAQTGIITAIAGMYSVFGYSGDGGPATSAIFYWPEYISVDNIRHCLFISDSKNHCVRKINLSTGYISLVAGTCGYSGFSGDNGTATSARLYWPAGTLIDSIGNVYICDVANMRVRKVDAITGIITTFAGMGLATPMGDGGPATAANLGARCLAFDKGEKNLFITDDANKVIRQINMTTGIINTIAGNGTAGFYGDGGPPLAAEFDWPYGISINASGNIYVADHNNSRIREISAVNSITEINNKQDFTIWPNPVIDKINIKTNSAKIKEVCLFDIYGKEIKNTIPKTINDKTEIDVSDLKEGLYLVQIKTDKEIFTKKIIVQR